MKWIKRYARVSVEKWQMFNSHSLDVVCVSRWWWWLDCIDIYVSFAYERAAAAAEAAMWNRHFDVWMRDSAANEWIQLSSVFAGLFMFNEVHSYTRSTSIVVDFIFTLQRVAFVWFHSHLCCNFQHTHTQDDPHTKKRIPRNRPNCTRSRFHGVDDSVRDLVECNFWQFRFLHPMRVTWKSPAIQITAKVVPFDSRFCATSRYEMTPNHIVIAHI